MSDGSKNSFICTYCGKSVPLAAPGTHNRNHCPFCLFSMHVDINPGDRASACRGKMRPIGRFSKPDGEQMLVHECLLCRYKRKNRIAGDDNESTIQLLPEIVDPTVAK